MQRPDVPAHIGFGREGRAAFAVDPTRSRGRLHPEPESPTRTPFQRDRDRIVHSAAFRRLKGKTQVFVPHEGDHYRTRLTHSIEVAQIARALARAFRLDEDLAEALALAHDLGHTPFGHAGERAMSAVMAAHDGFDHNAQTLRVVTRLERRYAEFDGLNLSWETLEGLVKHNGPLLGPEGTGDAAALPFAIREFVARFDLELATFPSLEAQVAAIADDIAYNAHDIDDGLRAGLVRLDELASVPFVGDLLAEVRARYPGLERSRTIAEVTRRLITGLVEDVIAETARRLAAADPASAEAVRAAGRPLVGFSSNMTAALDGIRAYLWKRVYRAPEVMRVMSAAETVVAELVRAYMTAPAEMPAEWTAGLDPADTARRARRVCDYVAGMTDAYALREFDRLFPGRLAALPSLFDATPELG